MAEYHALVSPSGSYKWLVCPGSLAMESLIENQTSEFADWGTANHELSADCLNSGLPPSSAKGQVYKVGDKKFVIDDEHIACADTYTKQVLAYVDEYKARGAISVELFVEQQVPIGHITGEKDARGTADFVIIAIWEDGTATIHVGDLKTGRGVEVEADDNPQLKLYALGAVEKFGLLYEFKDVRLSIHQPRIQTAASEWECSIDHLMAFSKFASQKAEHALNVMHNEQPGAWTHHLVAGDHCKKAFCRARGNCMKLDQFVADSIGADFDVIASLGKDAVVQMVKGLPLGKQPTGCYTTAQVMSRAHGMPKEIVDSYLENACDAPPTLSDKMAVLDIIDDWCKAVRGRVEYELLHGNEVPGYKLVEGRAGSRAWNDAEAAENKLKSMRLKKEEMYDLKLISPTTAEKVLKATPKRWASVQDLISRSKGQPSVAPASDKRPALVIAPPADDFEAIDDGSDLL